MEELITKLTNDFQNALIASNGSGYGVCSLELDLTSDQEAKPGKLYIENKAGRIYYLTTMSLEKIEITREDCLSEGMENNKIESLFLFNERNLTGDWLKSIIPCMNEVLKIAEKRGHTNFENSTNGIKLKNFNNALSKQLIILNKRFEISINDFIETKITQNKTDRRATIGFTTGMIGAFGGLLSFFGINHDTIKEWVEKCLSFFNM